VSILLEKDILSRTTGETLQAGEIGQERLEGQDINGTKNPLLLTQSKRLAGRESGGKTKDEM